MTLKTSKHYAFWPGGEYYPQINKTEKYIKNANAKNPTKTNVFFKYAANFSKFGGFNGSTFTVVL